MTASPHSPPLIINFHTADPLYRAYAARLRASCEHHQLEHYLEEVNWAGRWVEICARKAEFVRHCLHHFQRPVLWVDADGALIRKPYRLYDAPASFAVRAEARPHTIPVQGRGLVSLPAHWPADVSPRWMNSGTLYFNYNEEALALVDHWWQRCQACPRDYDQWSLQWAWAHTRPDTLWLPQEYCFTAHHTADQPVVIAQDFASVSGKVDRN